MARLPYVERDQAPPPVQRVYDALQKATGRVLNIFRLMAHHPVSLPPFLEWYPTLREGPLVQRTCASTYSGWMSVFM